MTPLSDDPNARSRQLANLRPAPPAPPGNARRRVHGAFAAIAQEQLDATVLEIYTALSLDAPLRDREGQLPAEDHAQVVLLARAFVQSERVERYITEHGSLDGRGRVRPAADLARRLRLEIASHLDALGLTPRSRLKLGIDLARGMNEAEALADHVRRNYGDEDGRS